MQKGFDKYIATILIFLQIGMLLPAESFAELGRRAGMERLDRYLEKAARENDEQRWEELSAQGIAAAIADWESIYLYEKEQSEERQKPQSNIWSGSANVFFRCACRWNETLLRKG